MMISSYLDRHSYSLDLADLLCDFKKVISSLYASAQLDLTLFYLLEIHLSCLCLHLPGIWTWESGQVLTHAGRFRALSR
jgi:hypothetical protein